MDTDPASPPSSPPAWRKLFRVGFTLLALAGLAYLLHRIGWDRIGQSLLSLGWHGVTLLLLLDVMEAVFDSLAFRASIPEPVGLIPVVGTNLAGGLLNRFIPWEAGEVLKGALLRRHVSGVAAITGTVLWNYLFKLSKPVVILAAALVGLLWGAPLGQTGVWILVAAVIAFLPYLGLYLLFRVGVAHRLSSLLARVRLLGRSPEALLDKAREVDRGLRDFLRNRPRQYALTLVYQILARLASLAALHAVLILLGQPFSIATTCALWAALSVMSYLVGLLPTRLGTTEAGAFFVFKLVGLDPPVGLMAQLILTLKAVVVSGLLAALALL